MVFVCMARVCQCAIQQIVDFNPTNREEYQSPYYVQIVCKALKCAKETGSIKLYDSDGPDRRCMRGGAHPGLVHTMNRRNHIGPGTSRVTKPKIV